MWRRHRFLSLEEKDGVDKVIAGSEFYVHYLGSIYVKQDFEKTEKILTEFYENLLDKLRTRKPTVLQLIVDISGAVVYDNEGRVLERFELCNIKDVTYCDNIQEYSKYVALVGQEESDPNVKAHILVCENQKIAKQLYKTFIETFALGFEMKKQQQSNSPQSLTQDYREKEAPSHKLTGNDKSSTNYLNTSTDFLVQEEQKFFYHNHKQSKWNSPTVMCCPVDQGLDSEGNSETYLDECFTELARSRSSISSDVTPMSMSLSQNGNRFQHFSRLDGDVFR